MEYLNRNRSSDDEVMTPLFQRRDVAAWIQNLKPESMADIQIETQETTSEQ